MPARVVDASALAAILFGEPAGGKVTKALGRGPVFAPTLLRYEVGRVCLKKIRRHRERRTDLLASLELLPRLDIQEVDVPAGEATELAERAGLTVYDAAYLWLAASLGAELVTLDERLEAAARNL
ncbi:MAG TPA: type II toxin-antitoxin system VapC family toxin [Gemmatimonadota bacterium]|nr:type II toxin-antitoxin system VapC family toxin [Gemmatimonadota bacterium]